MKSLTENNWGDGRVKWWTRILNRKCQSSSLSQDTKNLSDFGQTSSLCTYFLIHKRWYSLHKWLEVLEELAGVKNAWSTRHTVSHYHSILTSNCFQLLPASVLPVWLTYFSSDQTNFPAAGPTFGRIWVNRAITRLLASLQVKRTQLI